MNNTSKINSTNKNTFNTNNTTKKNTNNTTKKNTNNITKKNTNNITKKNTRNKFTTKNNNVFRWETVLNAKIDGSREIFATQEFQNAYAEYLKSVGINTWEILCVKDKRVDTYFIRLQDAGKCLGSYNSDATYTRQTDLEELNNTAALHKWVF